MKALLAPNSRGAALAFPKAMATRSSVHRKRGTARPTFCECGDHAFATLTKGYVALVSPEDADQFRYYWNATIAHAGYVVVARSKSIGHQKHKTVVLAREILGIDDRDHAEHADRNPLDNRRTNIRRATPTQNQRNRKSPSSSLLGVKGVWPHRGKFRAGIRFGGRQHNLGVFVTIDEARLAYAVAAFWFHGEFARVA